MIKKQLIFLAMVLLIIIIPIFLNESENLTYAKENNELQINKTAKENDDGTYTITLDAKGEESIKEGKKADIVIIIDTSTSMYNKIEEVKKAAKSLVNNVLESSKQDDVKIALGHFSNYAYTDCELTSDKYTINKKIESLIHGGDTNTKDGIRKASELLEDSRIDAQKYVLFFTDGFPNIVGDEETKNEYKNNFSLYEKNELIKIKKPKYPNAKFYTIGVFTDYNGNRQKDVNFLASIQNVISPTNYEDKYFSDKLESINGIFNDIHDEISRDISPMVAKDVKLHDIVKKEFIIVPNSYKLTDLNENEINLDPKDINLSKTKNEEDEITLKIGDIIANKKDKGGKFIGGVKVSFNVCKKDPYFGGKQIPTNLMADIKYKNPSDESEKKQIFNIPQVDIPYKSGEITIEKEVENENNDTFSISIFGNSGNKNHKYTVDLKGNKKTTMNFYLRNETTDISNNKDFTKNYFTEGLYEIEEIVPMNYKKYKVMIKDKNNNWEEFEDYVKDEKNIADGKVIDGKLFIGKDNSNINIKVKNITSNNMYWNDKVNVENKFQYKKD